MQQRNWKLKIYQVQRMGLELLARRGCYHQCYPDVTEYPWRYCNRFTPISCPLCSFHLPRVLYQLFPSRRKATLPKQGCSAFSHLEKEPSRLTRTTETCMPSKWTQRTPPLPVWETAQDDPYLLALNWDSLQKALKKGKASLQKALKKDIRIPSKGIKKIGIPKNIAVVFVLNQGCF